MRGRATNTMSTNAKSAQDILDQIAQAAGKKVTQLFLEMRDQINEAITACVEDAQDEADKSKEGKHAVLSIPVAIKWDLDTRAVQVALSVAIKRKATADIVIDDPNQSTLPFRDADGDKMPDKANNALRKLTNAIREGRTAITMGEAVDAKAAIEAARAQHAAALIDENAKRIAGGEDNGGAR